MTKSQAEQQRIAAITLAAQALRQRQSNERLLAVEEIMLTGVRYTKQSLAAELGISLDRLMRWAKRVGITERLQAWLVTDAENRAEDILWMMRSQPNEIEVAKRLGITTDALWNWCSRNGHLHDIWEPLTEYRRIERDDWKGDRSLLRPRTKQEYLHVGRSEPVAAHRPAATRAAARAHRRERKVA